MKLVPICILAFFTFSCNDKFEFNNPVDPQVELKSPSDLQVDSMTETQVVLRWKNNTTVSNPNTQMQNEIQMSEDGGTNFIKTTAVGAAESTAKVSGSFSSTKTYSFRVVLKTSKAASPYSNTVVKNLSFPAPTNLAVIIINETNARLTWTNSNTIATKVIIERSIYATYGFVVVDSVTISDTTKNVAGFYYKDSTYYFRVMAKSSINRIYSNTVSGILGFAPPTNVQVTFTNEQSATISWQLSNPGVTTLVIERSTNQTNSFIIVDSVYAGTTSKAVAGIYFKDTTYYFRVLAKSNINRVYSSTVSGTLDFAAPTNFLINYATETSANLSWTINNSYAKWIIIERSTGNSNSFVTVDSVQASANNKIVSGIYYADTTYYFRIYARSDINKSSIVSNSKSLIFSAPTNLNLNFTSETSANLSWTLNNSYAKWIIIERSSGNSNNFVTVDSIQSLITNKAVSGAYYADTNYYFRIYARGDINTTPRIQTSAQLQFNSPSSVSISSINDNSITVQWTLNNPYASKIIIERSINNQTSFLPVDSISLPATQKTITSNFDKTIQYYYRLQVKSGINQSLYTKIIKTYYTMGELYAGGFFTNADGKTANYIAKGNGSSWSAVGSGMDGNIRALTMYNSELYAGGYFTNAGGKTANCIAKWNGSTWSAVGSGMNNGVYVLYVYNSELYAGGAFTMADGKTTNYVAKWNGSTWSAIGSGMNDVVYALAVYNGELYAGGQFTTADGKTANYIAKWNGSTWSAVGNDVNENVQALAVYNGELYAGGYFTGKTANYIAKWNGSAWSAVGSGVPSITSVSTLVVYNSTLYLGGIWYFPNTGQSLWSVYKWNGSTWSNGGISIENGSIYSFGVFNSELYAGGYFGTAGGITVNNIAKWNGSAWNAVGSGMNSSVCAFTVFNAGWTWEVLP
jgi:hypothetical protein